MKKSLIYTLIFVTLLLVLICLPSFCFAAGEDVVDYGTCGDDLEWELTEDGTLTISGSGAMDDYFYQDQPWFSYMDQIKAVVIGNEVTYIGRDAFINYESLTSVTFEPGSKLQVIGKWAFEFTGITNITIPASVTTIEIDAFEGCKQLTSVTFESGSALKTIGERAFDSTGITAITIPASVEEIQSTAFYYCQSLKEVKFEEGSSLKTIGDRVFSMCSNLTTVVMAGDVPTTGGDSIFHQCPKNLIVYVDADYLENYQADTNWKKQKFHDVDLWMGNAKTNDIGDQTRTGNQIKPAITSVKAKNGMVIDSAYYTVTYGENKKVGTGTVTITAAADNAGGYSGTLEVTFNIVNPSGSCGAEGDNVKWELDEEGTLHIVGEGAMKDYYPETEVPWHQYKDEIAKIKVQGISVIGEYAFAGCASVTAIELPDGLSEIGAHAFAGCSELTEITLPDTVEALGNNAFYECAALETITLSSGMEMIYGETFAYCSSLESIEIPGNIEYIWDNAFAYCCALESITIPEGVLEIGDLVFEHCESLASITFNGDAPVIREGTFDGVTATAYYPCNNDTWNVDSMKNYGGTLTWAVKHKGDAVTDKAEAPTCTETGLTEGSHYSVCGHVIVAQETRPALTHDWSEWTETKAPTCTEDGEAARTCSRGDAAETKVLTKNGHTEVSHQGKEATCTEAGWKAYVTCENCNYSTYEAIGEKGHTEVPHEGKAATCTEAGWKAYVTCKNCNYSTYEAIGKKGHTEVSHEGKAATCTEAGWEAYVTCENCEYSTYTEIPAGHDWTGEWKTTKEATCKEAGVKTKTCKNNCGQTQTESVPKLTTHGKEEILPAKAPTATETGLTEGKKCTVCGTVTAAQNVVPALGEEDNDDVPAKEGIDRIYGSNRYETAFKAADELKALRNGEQFDSVIIACGTNFADALAGSYLAAVKDAPILLVQPNMVNKVTNFADSLSASATGKPILLVGAKLTSAQKQFLAGTKGTKYILGGTNAVSANIENELKAYGAVKRLGGANRYATSVLIAETFFSAPKSAVLSYAQNFPDGLCGGVIAYKQGAPMLLVTDSGAKAADTYTAKHGIRSGYVLGGTGLISDATMKAIFS